MNNYNAELGLKQHLICGAELACTFSFFISLINRQLNSLYCIFSHGSKKLGPCKIFWETKSGAIFEISPPLVKVGGGG